MGEIKEFKPRKQDTQGETKMLVCGECDHALFMIEDDGSLVCVMCGTWTTLADITDEGFFT